MSGLVRLLSFFLIIFLANTTTASDRKFNLGQIATLEEVAGWDIDVTVSYTHLTLPTILLV